MNSKWTIESALEQIKACDFECDGGKLENSQAWRWLQDRIRALSTVTEAILEMAPKEEPVYVLTHNAGDDQDFGVKVAYWSIAKQIKSAHETAAAPVETKPSVHDYVSNYRFELDGGNSYCPRQHEAEMIEDAIEGYLACCGEIARPPVEPAAGLRPERPAHPHSSSQIQEPK